MKCGPGEEAQVDFGLGASISFDFQVRTLFLT
jgi:hypothetical protein